MADAQVPGGDDNVDDIVDLEKKQKAVLDFLSKHFSVRDWSFGNKAELKDGKLQIEVF